MKKPGLVSGMLAAVAMAFGAGTASAQAYPVKPIRLAVTGIGSGGDFAGRIIAQGVSPALGQQMIVDNRGSSNLPALFVSRAAPDGYTLCLQAAPLWITPFLRKTPYDPIKDFTPVTLAITSPNILVIHPSLPAKTVKELIAFTRSKPGQLNYAASGIGGSGFLSAELFKYMAKLDMTRVNYKGGGIALTELITGQVQMMFANAGAVAPHMQSGRLRALAVTSLKRSSLLPELPPIAEVGLPGYELVSVQGIFAPAGTPRPIIELLNREIVSFLQTPEAKQAFLKVGVETIGSTPEEAAAKVKSEMDILGKVIRAAGIKVEP